MSGEWLFILVEILLAAGAMHGIVVLSGFTHHDRISGFLAAILFVPMLHSFTVTFSFWNTYIVDTPIGFSIALGVLYFGALAVFATAIVKVIYREDWGYSLQVSLPWLALVYCLTLIPVFVFPDLATNAGRAFGFV